MNINKRNFLSLLDRMEKKGTFNESIEKKYILTEGVGDDIMVGIKKSILNVSDIEFKLSNLIGGGEVKLGPSTNNLVTAVNTDVTTLANQIVDLSNKRIVPTDGFIKSSSILKAFDLFIDNFVNSDLRRLGILEGIDVGDVERLKSFLKGGGLVPESFVLRHKGIVDTVLTPLRKQRLSTEIFVTTQLLVFSI